MKREIYKVQDRAYPNIVKQELKEQLQQNLLQVFEDVNLADETGDLYSDSVRDRVLDHMCDVVIKTIDEHER
tara:strand:+ start:625 stop:840 length:216 start_codon:yes stop_codon:yes gene_type:complete